MKKLLIFLMIAIPLVIIIVVNLTVNVVSGFVSIPVDSISLNLSQIEGKVDDSIKIEATILPKNASNQEIIWSSTNEDVAMVDSNGNVSFVGFGTGYITATTTDGNKKASCYFYITDTKAHEIYLTSDYKENENFFVGIGNNLQLKSIVYPSEALNKDVIYTTEDETIATVDANGLVHGVKEGKVKIVSTSAENSLISSSIIVEVVKPLESIILAEEKVVVANSTYQISYDVYPKDASITAVQYKSLNEEIATVSSYGLVTFNKQGTAQIEIVSVQGQIKTSLEIVYTDGYAYDLVLETNSISEKIEKGETYINYTTVPLNLDVDVTFTSDDEKVVYVDDSGYVQFIGGGNTLIRARIQKNETEYIEKIISIYIESPATKIEMDDSYVIATKELKITPKSYPANSTNKNFYFVSKDNNIATVSEDGVVTILRDGYCSVEIEIYANEKNSSVKKTVTVTYTNGYPIELVLTKELIEIEYGDFAEIEANVYPLDSKYKDISYKILSQTQNGGENGVVELLGNGGIKAIGGGTARIEVSCEKYSGEKIKKYCNVIVNRKVEEINFLTDIDLNEGEYVTCNPLVSFTISPLTLDATNKNLKWTLNSNNAIRKTDDSIYFNNAGTAEIVIKSEDGNCEKTVVIRYLKDKIISAEFEEIPEEIEVGNIFEFKVLSTIPSNAIVKPYLRISNQSTLDSSGKVFEALGDGKIKAVAGGSATITVIVANMQYNFQVNSIRKMESLEISPANIKTTNSRVKLQTKILPEDTSNKEIMFTVKDTSVASIEDGYIIFKKNGIAHITATALDGSDVCFEFTIEKIEKGTGAITVDGKPIKMMIGETNALNFEEGKYEEITIKIKSQTPAFADQTVISLEGNIIKALAIGSAEVECTLVNEHGTEEVVVISVSVIHLCEDIIFDTNLDYVQEGYVTAEDVVDLNFKLLPEYTTDKQFSVSIVKFISQESEEFKPFLNEGKLNFTVPGIAIIKVDSKDGAVSEQFSIKYTGGDAINAILNYEGRQTLSVNEVLEVRVEKWIPYNTANKQITLKEKTHTQGVDKVVEINGNIIKAVAGGTSIITVTVSNQISKELTIVVTNKINNISIEERIVSSSDRVVINPIIEPSNATNKTLAYSIDNKEIAKIEDKTVVFSKPGKVIVTISTTDGSNITKNVEVVSTFGYVDSFELITNTISIKKNSTTNLRVRKYYPSDATKKEFSYEIISSMTNDSSSNTVLTVSQEGVISGSYGGKAVVRVYTTNYYGEKIYQDCEVDIISEVSDLEIMFERELEKSQGSIVVAKPHLGFSAKIYPSDASNKDVEIIVDNEDVAMIVGNSIHFLTSGKVNIQVNSKGNPNVSKSYSFYFTDNTLIGITIDTKDFTEKATTLTLRAGEEYKLKILKCLPSDKEDVVFTIEDKNENRNSQTLQVMSFKDGVITAMNGGEATFTLKADSIVVGKFKVRVQRDCESIHVDSTEVFVNYKTVTIKGEAYPLDTDQKEVKYTIIGGDKKIIDGKETYIATIDIDGKVTFTEYGTITVAISSVANENVYTLVKVEYANTVKKISFNETVSMIYSGYKVQLIVKGEPFNVAPFTVVYESSNNAVATVSENGLVVAKEKGTVEIKAYVKENPEIYTTRTFNIVPVLSALELELDKINDDLGIGGYRVWGTRFVGGEDPKATHGNYQMKIKVIKPENSGIKLIWKTSNPELATVDKNGLVTFIGPAGKVTISVEPEAQANPDWPQKDEYTFTLVDGVNIYNYDQLKLFTDEEYCVVLQSDIVVPENGDVLVIKNNVHGNGHMINFDNIARKTDEKFNIRRSNVVVDNIHLRGAEFKENAALSELEGAGKIVGIRDVDGVKTVGVVMRYCKIENAYVCVNVVNSEANFEGCIIRNALATCLQLTAGDYSTIPSVVSIDNSIISRALFCGILFEPKKKNVVNANYKCRLIMGNNVKIYNWLRVDEFQIDFIQKELRKIGVDKLVNIKEELTRIFHEYPDFIYNYNGTEYVMLGVGSAEADVKVSGQTVLSYISNGVAEVPGPYVYKNIKDQIDLPAVYADLKLDVYTLKNNQDFITPASTYTENEELYRNIRKNVEG